MCPTRVHTKFGGFHISTPGCTQNPPSFPLPNRDAPKTHPILGATLRRGYLRGVCNTPLHGYTQNLPVFRPKSLAQDISVRMLLRPTWVHEKPARFHIPAHDMARNPAGFGFCHTTWPKTWRVLDFATRHGAKPGGFWTLSHDIAQNSAGFGLCHSTWHKTRRVLDFATRHGAKPGGFWTLPHDIA